MVKSVIVTDACAVCKDMSSFFKIEQVGSCLK